MKTTLEERLATASANMKLTAHKAFKHPVSSMLSLCVLGICAATIITFSQNALPVDREITDISGRKIQGKVMEITRGSILFKFAKGTERTILISDVPEKDRARIETDPLPTYFTFPATLGPETVEVTKRIEGSIKFSRNFDGQTFNIPLSRLSEDDRKWVTSLPFTWARPSGIPNENPPEGLKMAATKTRREMAEMSVADIQQLIKANDYKTETWLAENEWSARNYKNHEEYRYQSQVPHLIALSPNPTDEKMSLREELKTAGVKSLVQTPDACQLYSGYFLYQYLIWKGKLEPVTFEEFRMTAKSFDPVFPAEMLAKTPGLENRFAKGSIIKAGLKLRGIHPTFIPLFGPNEATTVELIKHFLRKGYPIWGAIDAKRAGHAILFTGFETINGKTRFEALDSGGVNDGDNGYKWFNPGVIREAYVISKE